MSKDEKLIQLVEEVVDCFFVLNEAVLAEENIRSSVVCGQFISIAMRLQFLLDLLKLGDVNA